MTTTTYDWIKRLPSALLRKDEVPLIGFPPPFPWDPVSAKLAELLSIPGLSIKSVHPLEWRTKENLLTGLGTPATLYITPAPSLPPLCWAMPSLDIQYLVSLLLLQKPDAIQAIDPEFKEEFFQFITIQAINAIMTAYPDKTLSPQLLEKGELPQEPSLCLDVAITVKDRSLSGRLILSPEFIRAWKERYKKRSLDVSPSLLQHLDVTVHLEAGKMAFTRSAWSNVHLGDFLILDSCSLKPGGEGRIMLTVNGIPMFRGKIKDGNIKILENPLYHEGDAAMSSDNHHTDEDFTSFDEESEAEFEEDEEIDQAGEDEEFENLFEEETEHAPEPSTVESHEEAPASHAAELEKSSAKPATIEETPFTVLVEVGRLQMSMQKLMELQPGNLLELDVHPEDGVDLTVNGKRIAKGELLIVGEALGVRILDIG